MINKFLQIPSLNYFFIRLLRRFFFLVEICTLDVLNNKVFDDPGGTGGLVTSKEKRQRIPRRTIVKYLNARNLQI